MAEHVVTAIRAGRVDALLRANRATEHADTLHAQKRWSELADAREVEADAYEEVGFPESAYISRNEAEAARSAARVMAFGVACMHCGHDPEAHADVIYECSECSCARFVGEKARLKTTACG